VIRRVVEDGAYSNLTLGGELGRSSLDERDRRLAADLAYGTLRRLLRLDAEIEEAAGRGVARIDREALAVLRLGAYQLRYTRIPSHAAVGETVGLAAAARRGFVNAVLRRLAREEPSVAGAESSDEAVSARTGLVPWLVAELGRVLPGGEVEAAAAALASPAELCLRTNTCRVTRGDLLAALAAAGHAAEPGNHHPDAVRVPSATPAALPGYREGWFAVQDEASAVVTSALDIHPGERVLDACAGPGGKSSHLTCLAGDGGLVVAADLSPARARLVRAAGGRMGLRPLVLVQDARRPATRSGFDAVLVDAPCSGLGSARRRPELLWRPRKEDESGLARLQVAILSGAAAMVRPGGRLVYSVCTFPRAETDAVVRAFLSKHVDFHPLEVTGPDGSAASHRLWPHRHGTDAMFFAAFRRAGDANR
jgi:16S rRNA (cytosine967-C5)-methyltransferase